MRPLFLGERDASIAKIVWNYFSAVQSRWSDAWNQSERGNILNRSTGFIALMRFLRPAYFASLGEGQIPTTDCFLKIFSLIDISDEEFSPIKYNPGSSGQSSLYAELLEKSGLQDVG